MALSLTVLMYAIIQRGSEQFANELGLNREVCLTLCNPGFPFLHNCENVCPGKIILKSMCTSLCLPML